ncbi:MAG: hypothetical protein JWO85_2660 [Candidatus Eremiobacteraeota bacterium]|nr:hypothetical protein [Candidatus Eremiobacteraeota bacterium]
MVSAMAMFPPVAGPFEDQSSAPTTFNPTLPAGYNGSNPAAAIAARQRENRKRDEKRQAGAQALKVVKGAGIPPPPNSTADAVPQYVPPPGPAPQQGPPMDPATGKPMAAPQQSVPDFKPAEYVPPKKGLEYLALGLGVLFPGAPIAKMAAGFAGGLQQNAEQSYQRREHTAEQQYKVAEAKAQADFQNAQAKYGMASDEAKRAFVNLQAQRGVDEDTAKHTFDNAAIKYKADQDVRARGIDPRTQKPFMVPPTLAQPLGPHASATNYAGRENALAQFYTSVGATDIAAQHAAQAQAYNKQAIDDANNARALSIAIFREQQQNAREASRESAADARESNREAAANYRETLRLAHEDARATLTNGAKMATLKDEALRAGKDFYASWAKAIKPPVDANGNPRMDAGGHPAPPTITPQMAQMMSKTFSLIDRNADPAGAAQYYAETLQDHVGDATNPIAKELLLERGRTADLNRRSRGVPIIPFRPPKGTAKVPTRLPVADEVKRAREAGRDDATIRTVLKQHGYSDTEINGAMPAGPGLTHALGAAVNDSLANPVPM